MREQLTNKINKRPYPHWGLAHETGCSHGSEDQIVIDVLGNK